MTIEKQIHHNDLPDYIQFTSNEVAIDTEAMGLNIKRDRLCLIQLTFDGKICHLIKMDPNGFNHAPNLTSLLKDKSIEKIFHFARFDVALLYETFGILTENIYCTKIASKLARTYTERHGLKTICNELLKIDISKKEQASDWGQPTLTQEQKNYAASDVIHLHELKEKLTAMLIREGRMEIAKECFNFLPHLAKLDCMGWSETLFAHI